MPAYCTLCNAEMFLSIICFDTPAILLTSNLVKKVWPNKGVTNTSYFIHVPMDGVGHYASNACGVGAHGPWYGSSVRGLFFPLADIPESGFKSSTEHQRCTVCYCMFEYFHF